MAKRKTNTNTAQLAQADAMEAIRAEMMGAPEAETDFDETDTLDETLSDIADDITDTDDSDDDSGDSGAMAPRKPGQETPRKRGVPKGTKRGPNRRTIPDLLEEHRKELALLTDDLARNARIQFLEQRIAHYEEILSRHEREKAERAKKAADKAVQDELNARATAANLGTKRRDLVIAQFLAAGMSREAAETAADALAAMAPQT